MIDAAGFVGPDGDLDPVPGADLAHDTGEVGFDGAEADVEVGRDLGVGPAGGRGDEDLLLACGERINEPNRCTC